jgi:hypothetical protein
MRLKSRGSSWTLPTLLAVLALAMFPLVARAETSNEIVYPLAPAELESKGVEHAHAPKPKPKAKPETKPDIGTEPGGVTEAEEHHQGGTTPSQRGNHPPGNSGGAPRDHRPKADGETSNRPRESVRPSLTVATTAPESPDGGSSPVLPILIAVALLAVASIGFVVYRERGGRAATGTG